MLLNILFGMENYINMCYLYISMFVLDTNMAKLYGVLLGDGCISRFIHQNRTHHAIRIDGNSVTDRSYYNYLQDLIFSITNKKIKIRYRKRKKAIYIMFENKELANFFHEELDFPFGKKTEIKIARKIIENQEFLKYVLRGFFDTDGCIYFTKNNSKIRYYPIIELSTHSSKLLYQLKNELEKLDFFIRISHFKDSVKLHGKKNVIKWMKEIGSSNPHKLGRFNAWKKNDFIFAEK